MKAIFFGSIGTIIETSEYQRRSFNLAFKKFDLDWYWNTATYCHLLKSPGGIKRIDYYSNGKISKETIRRIHKQKEIYFHEFLSKKKIKPRRDILKIIEYAIKNKIKLGFITTTSLNNVKYIKEILSSKINFKNFSCITSRKDIKFPKPNTEIYQFALKKVRLKKENVIAIEDSKVNFECATNAGIKSLFYPGEFSLVSKSDKVNYNIYEKIREFVKE